MTELTVVRTLDATPQRVWSAFTTEELARWFWPPRWETSVQVDARVGGRFRVASVIAGMAISGEFVAFEPITRLVQTWRWDGEENETLVTIAIDPTDAGTVLTITHERFDSIQTRDAHLQGWNDCLDRLPESLA